MNIVKKFKTNYKEIEFKKAIFTSNQIIIKKRKCNVTIPIDKIDRLLYTKFSFIMGFFN